MQLFLVRPTNLAGPWKAGNLEALVYFKFNRYQAILRFFELPLMQMPGLVETEKLVLPLHAEFKRSAIDPLAMCMGITATEIVMIHSSYVCSVPNCVTIQTP